MRSCFALAFYTCTAYTYFGQSTQMAAVLFVTGTLEKSSSSRAAPRLRPSVCFFSATHVKIDGSVPPCLQFSPSSRNRCVCSISAGSAGDRSLMMLLDLDEARSCAPAKRGRNRTGNTMGKEKMFRSSHHIVASIICCRM
jgi:hypothetical protein